MRISQKNNMNLTQIINCMNNMRKKKTHNSDTSVHANNMNTRLHDIPMCNFLSDFRIIFA